MHFGIELIDIYQRVVAIQLQLFLFSLVLKYHSNNFNTIITVKIMISVLLVDMQETKLRSPDNYLQII